MWARRDGAVHSWAEAMPAAVNDSQSDISGHLNPAFVYSSEDEA